MFKFEKCIGFTANLVLIFLGVCLVDGFRTIPSGLSFRKYLAISKAYGKTNEDASVSRSFRLLMSSSGDVENINRKTELVDVPSSILTSKLMSGSGAAVDINNVDICLGHNQILSNIQWSVYPDERWAIVGRNGEGKSTLLKAITSTGGEALTITKGEILISKKQRLGLLEQKGVSGSTATVRDEVSSRMDRLVAATKAFKEVERAVTNGDTSEATMMRFSDASIEFEAAGGYDVEKKIANVLNGLGFKKADWDRKCSEFSGGWQMRIALAKLLLCEPDLLILDEPTNHLDKSAKTWLGNYLSKYSGTLIVVSHDEGLLRSAVSSIAEIKNGVLELYKSKTYDQWLVERESRMKVAKSEYESSQREIARLQTFIDKFGSKTFGASLAQSKQKTIDKLEAAQPDAPVTNDKPAAKLVLPHPPRGSEILLEIENGSISWPSTDGQPRPPVIKDINLLILRGMKIAVRGPNGAGKSTLFQALSGSLPLDEGIRFEGDGLELGFFQQDLAQALDQKSRAVDVVVNSVNVNPPITEERARSVLGSLGLTKDKGIRIVGDLSGGEKARVALASFVLTPHNLLLLDEPSNHLDVSTIKVLTKALKEFTGTVMVISHDREFLEEFKPTHVLTVNDGQALLEERELGEDDWSDGQSIPKKSQFAYESESNHIDRNYESGKTSKKNKGKKNKTK